RGGTLPLHRPFPPPFQENAMSESRLIAHCGARVVTPEELRAVKAPEPTRTWFPLSHGHVIDTVERTLHEGGFRVESSQFALSRAVAGLHQFKEAEAVRTRRFQQTDVTDTQAESLMLRAYEKDVVSHRLLPRVIQEWRAPSFEDFQPRTLWSLLNAFTTVLGD